MSADRLVYMANQIGAAFNHQDDAEAEASIANHIRKFWDPRMRKGILEHEAAGGAEMAPRVLAAVRSLR